MGVVDSSVENFSGPFGRISGTGDGWAWIEFGSCNEALGIGSATGCCGKRPIRMSCGAGCNEAGIWSTACGIGSSDDFGVSVKISIGCDSGCGNSICDDCGAIGRGISTTGAGVGKTDSGMASVGAGCGCE